MSLAYNKFFWFRSNPKINVDPADQVAQFLLQIDNVVKIVAMESPSPNIREVWYTIDEAVNRPKMRTGSQKKMFENND